MRQSKKIYLELLRVLSIFGVLYCHTGQRGIHFYQVTDQAVAYWCGLFLVAFSQICVPLFFMISGALLLGKEESLSKTLKHRVLRFLLVIVLVVLLQYFFNYLKNPAIGFDLHTYFVILYQGGALTQHWFLYSYLAFLLILPFLQKMIHGITNQTLYVYLFLVYMLVKSILPIVAYHNEWGAIGLEVPFLLQIIFYPVMGYYLEEYGGKWLRLKYILLGWSVVLIAMLKNMQLNHLTYLETGMPQFIDLFTELYAVVFWVTVKWLCEKIRFPGWLNACICFMGQGVFFTYLFDEELRRICFPVYEKAIVLGAIPALMLWLLCTVILGIFLANILKKIPFIGKII